MTIEEMKARKIELGLTNEMVAFRAGIPISTVQKIFSGATRAPRKLTIEAIEKVLKKPEPGRPSVRRSPYEEERILHADKVSDSGAVYGAAGKERLYTIDDYYALPEDQRVELIDGKFYDMGAPALIHQKILGDLYILFREFADKHALPCEVFLSPCDVRLDRDNYTMVQPDLLVFCHEYDIHAIRYEGAPDLVVEILSPSSRSRDMVLKLYKYQSAGVREYWIVDPKFRTVTVHCFEEEDYRPENYDFDSEIPVYISGGECAIDFSRIMDRIRPYYEEG